MSADAFADLRPLVAAGLTHKQIAAQANMTAAAVYSRIKRMRYSDARKASGEFNMRGVRAAERTRTVIRMIGEGYTYAMIGKVLSISPKGVSSWAARLRVAGLLEPAPETPQVAAIRASFWTPARIELAVSLRRAGLSVGRVAQRLGTSSGGVSAHTAEQCRDLPGGLDQTQRTRQEADEARRTVAVEVPRPSKRAQRRCLGGCDRMFDSAGPGHRQCNSCGASASYRDHPYAL